MTEAFAKAFNVVKPIVFLDPKYASVFSKFLVLYVLFFVLTVLLVLESDKNYKPDQYSNDKNYKPDQYSSDRMSTNHTMLMSYKRQLILITYIHTICVCIVDLDSVILRSCSTCQARTDKVEE